MNFCFNHPYYIWLITISFVISTTKLPCIQPLIWPRNESIVFLEEENLSDPAKDLFIKFKS